MKHDNALPKAVQNLRRIWESKKTEMQFNQVEAAKELGWSQGAISHYLNDITEMGPAAVVKLANFLNVDPTEIDPAVISKLPSVRRIDVTRNSDDMTHAVHDTHYLRTDIPSIWVSINVDSTIENVPYTDTVYEHVMGTGSCLVNLCKPNLFPQNNYVALRLKKEKRLRFYHKKHPLPPIEQVHTMWAVISWTYN
tara:strand:+ start:359 stop:943 length:585 start_codon:yes stop_codon:yes gene_type:complete